VRALEGREGACQPLSHVLFFSVEQTRPLLGFESFLTRGADEVQLCGCPAYIREYRIRMRRVTASASDPSGFMVAFWVQDDRPVIPCYSVQVFC
jgi:hypothetical protein